MQIDLGQRLAILLAQDVHGLEELLNLGEHGLLIERIEGSAEVLLIEVRLLAHSAGKDACAQGTPRHDIDIVLFAPLEVGEGRLIDHGERKLHDVDIGNGACALDEGPIGVAQAEHADRALLLELIDASHRVLDGSAQVVGPVHEVHVDVIGVQALERCVELTQDRIGTAAVNALTVLDVGAVLRGDQNLVADTLDSLANDLLGVALAVDGSSVDRSRPRRAPQSATHTRAHFHDSTNHRRPSA